MAEEKRGIEETKDILDFMFSFVEAVGKAKKDGEMSWSDARYFIDPVKKLFEAVDDIEEVLPEIEDLSGEEYDQLVEYVEVNGIMMKKIWIGLWILQLTLENPF